MSQIAVTGGAMESFVIEGARPLSGRIDAAGNKNGALPILAACLLTDEPVTLENVPHIRDVETMTELLADLGADVDWTGPNDVRAHAELGARIEMNGRYEMTTDGLRGTSIFLDEASVMATENTIMAAALAPGRTVIGNAASEPHVQDLCRFLVSLGASIEGIGSNVLRIEGVDRPPGGDWRIASHHIEVPSFLGLA